MNDDLLETEAELKDEEEVRVMNISETAETLIYRLLDGSYEKPSYDNPRSHLARNNSTSLVGENGRVRIEEVESLNVEYMAYVETPDDFEFSYTEVDLEDLDTVVQDLEEADSKAEIIMIQTLLNLKFLEKDGDGYNHLLSKIITSIFFSSNLDLKSCCEKFPAATIVYSP